MKGVARQRELAVLTQATRELSHYDRTLPPLLNDTQLGSLSFPRTCNFLVLQVSWSKLPFLLFLSFISKEFSRFVLGERNLVLKGLGVGKKLVLQRPRIKDSKIFKDWRISSFYQNFVVLYFYCLLFYYFERIFLVRSVDEI